MRVLIAEHQPKVRFALRVTLERLPGMKSVSEVVDGLELVSQMRVMHPNLVLLDWELPGMDAREILQALREICPQLFVIALSGKEETRQAALQAGADAFVSKTDPPERLLTVIGEFWKSWTNRQYGETAEFL